MVAIASKAKSQKISFNSWTTESGLSQNTVYSICEDKNGYIWIGTRNGLNRFDGKEFKQYHPPTIDKSVTGENDITALQTDKDDVLWIGLNNGLIAYDLNKHSYFQIKLDSSIYKFSTNAIYRDDASNVWLATNIGIFLLKKRNPFVFEKFGRYDSLAIQNRNLRCIAREKNGTIWIGSNVGLTRIKAVNGQREYKTFKNNEQDQTSLSSNVVTAINIDKFGNLWVGTQSKGLNLFNRNTERFVRFTKNSTSLSLVNDNIRTMKSDSAGNLWIGTQEGVSKLNWQRKVIENYQNDPKNKHSLSQNSVHSIFIDRNNYTWIGTFFGGINLVNPFPSEFQVWQNNGTSSGLSNNVVSSVISDDVGNLWIGTEGGGLNYYDRKSKKFTYYNRQPDGIGSNLIKTIFKDKDGNIWVGTHAGGLNLYHDGGFIKYFYHPESAAFLNSEISTIAEDRSQHLWLGIQGGIQDLKIYKRSGINLTDISEEYDRNALAGRNIKKIFPDSKGNIWIATSDGLFVVRSDHKTIEPLVSSMLNTPSKISHVTSISEDTKGNIWLGVENGGLKKYNPATQYMYAYSLKKSGPEYDVLGILEDRKGYIWLSTANGLIKLDPLSRSFQTYTKADGLPSNTFNYNAYFKDNSGRFYFGSYNGIVSFDPSSFLSNTTDVPIVFTGLKTLNHTDDISIHASEALELNYSQNVFTIEFALLNYIKPEKNTYAYILKGFDKQWNTTDKPAATYMNLKPGHYTLVVKGANNDGKWGAAKQLSIVIQPPFWRTWWAYLIYALIITTVLFFIIRYFYLKELLKKEDILHQNKLDFFTNVTHEIRTHLTLILSPVDKMMNDRANDGYLQQQFQNIKKNANNLLRLSEELMDFRKVETEHLILHVAPYDVVTFIKEIYEHFTELSLARNIHISFTHDTSWQQLYFDKEQLEKVFFNLIGNAFKFTPDGGKIQVYIENGDDDVKVSVIDNGRGIAPEYKDKLFNNFFQINDSGHQNKGYGIGLALSNKIATLHSAKIEVDSRIVDEQTQERKTTFAVILKKGATHFNKQPGDLKPKITVDINNTEELHPLEALFPTEPNVVETYMKEKNLSILLVDDNPEIRMTIQEILSDKYNIILHEDASNGWEYAIEHIPDLIISDVMMPQEDGLSFCNRLKSDLRTCHIPVILLTAKTTQQDHIKGLDKGADIYLTKPFNRRVLELNVRNLLATRERIRENVKHYIQEGLLQTPIIAEEQLPVANELDNEFLTDIINIIEKYLDDTTFNVSILAQKIGMSVPVLYRKTKAVTNLSVNDFIKSVKLQKAAELLLQKNLAVYEVCYAVGYQDRKHFSIEFKKKFGKTPKQYSISKS